MGNLAISMFIALGTTSFAQSYEIKSDKKIELGAAERAAERIGEIRGTVPYTTQPGITTKEDFEKTEEKPDQSSHLSPRPAWTPPENAEEPKPPMVHGPTDGTIDGTLTGSIEKPKREWEIFNKYGRPVKNREPWYWSR